VSVCVSFAPVCVSFARSLLSEMRVGALDLAGLVEIWDAMFEGHMASPAIAARDVVVIEADFPASRTAEVRGSLSPPLD